MSVKKDELIKIIEHIAPPELMESWDNTGMQISVGKEDIERILVCLDICDETIDEAVSKGCDFIVSHHPLLFSGIRSIDAESAKGRYIVELIKREISVYSSHTSFDTVSGGNNDYLARLIGLSSVYAPENEPIMRIGELDEPLKMSRLCEIVDRKIMKNSGLAYSGDPEKHVRRVGICSGAGASLTDAAQGLQCDVLITGDVKYHDFQRAEELGISLIDAGHFETEIYFCANMGEKLKNELNGKAEVVESDSQKNCLKRFFSVI
ncbi:MAG: Nif3-like dinuclear metal center hexameric protein [Bacillota bacterium]|nr:Nif3-like dinuclear metal center hexameric protein [Bacillota bacterium]